MNVSRNDYPHDSNIPVPLKRKFNLNLEFETEEEVLAFYLIFNHYTLTASKFIKHIPHREIRDALGDKAAKKAQKVWNEFIETLGNSIN